MLPKIDSKKGISIMIGYILLIGIAVTVSIFVYGYLKTYIPKDGWKCPSEVSVFLSDKECIGDYLSITIKNNGRFSIGGYFIRVTNESEEIATVDLSDKLLELEGDGGVKVRNAVVFEAKSSNVLEPGESWTNLFEIGDLGLGNSFKIEIIPLRFQEEEEKTRLIVCGEAKISEQVECPV